jgi:predicted restriction endonuclease
MEYWEGRCAITGLAVPELLRASHIKPWAACETDAERLDVFNGLLLAPNLDAAFDRGLLTFSDAGAPVVSAKLGDSDRAALGLSEALQPLPLAAGHQRYLLWHRSKVFRC